MHRIAANLKTSSTIAFARAQHGVGAGGFPVPPGRG
jgi:hypothetical protein